MSDTHFDVPSLAIQPQLALTYGLEQSLMLAVVAELVGANEGCVVVEKQRLYGRALCLTRQRQAQILGQLAGLGLLQVYAVEAEEELPLVRIELYGAEVTTNQQLASRDVNQGANQCASQPSLVGFGGWNRSPGEGDELSRLFAAKEAHQQDLCTMNLDWQPTANIKKVLTQQHQISEAFALGIKDEFILYYMDKGRRETLGGWDQKFLKWIKTAQVQQQTAQARAQKNTQQQTNSSNEEARYAAKERRRRITASVLDINNTDW